MILMYPEGVSKYQPSMSPLKTGGMYTTSMIAGNATHMVDQIMQLRV